MLALMQRLKMYEPLFGRYKVDFIAVEYSDMAWVYLVDNWSYDEKYVLMKVKTVQAPEADIEKAIYDIMYKYDVMMYPQLINSSYLEEEQYYIEEQGKIVGADVCLISKYEVLDDIETPLLPQDIFELGLRYMNGYDCVQDEYRAYELFEKASRMHNSEAMCSLGYMYEVGLAVPVDCQKAMECYKKAGQLGNLHALCNYAFCLYEGIGCDRFKIALKTGR